MKFTYKSTLSCLIALFLSSMFVASCSEDEDLPDGGKPSISYIRVTNPDASDSLLVAAGQGSMVAIMGKNLHTVRQVWFNDRRAQLIPTFITPTTVITVVPAQTPDVITNTMKMIFADGDSLLYDFELAIAAPVIAAMRNEYTPVGESTMIEGDFFYEPISVLFTDGNGGTVSAEIISVEEEELEIVVPVGAAPGPITVETNFGTTESSLHYMDQRNILLNYDDLTPAGSWRPGPTASEGGIDGNYLRLYGTLNANQRVEDNYTSQFWGHTRYAQDTNFVQGRVDDLVMKFEARVDQWYGSVLQIAWGPYDNAGNQEVWSNLNAKGVWRPWVEADAIYSTDGEWITVTIPMTEMKYHSAQEDGNNVWIEEGVTFDPDMTGTLSFWVIATEEANESPVEVHIDNVRIVEK